MKRNYEDLVCDYAEAWYTYDEPDNPAWTDPEMIKGWILDGEGFNEWKIAKKDYYWDTDERRIFNKMSKKNFLKFCQDVASIVHCWIVDDMSEWRIRYDTEKKLYYIADSKKPRFWFDTEKEAEDFIAKCKEYHIK